MKLVIETGKVPKLYDDDGNRLTGITEMYYYYETGNGRYKGINKAYIEYYGDNHYPLCLHKYGWDNV